MKFDAVKGEVPGRVNPKDKAGDIPVVASSAKYHLSIDQADTLKGVVLVDEDLRHLILERYVRERGQPALVRLFSQFIGLANSVVANNREMIEMFAITECGLYPHDARKVNLPTLFGALLGVDLATGVNQRKACGGCAYRIGTPANQSPITTCDAEYCADEGTQFMCHEHMDPNGEPTRRCVGHAAKRRRNVSYETNAAFFPLDKTERS